MLKRFLDYLFPLYRMSYDFVDFSIRLRGSTIYDSYGAASRSLKFMKQLYPEGNHKIEKVKRIDTT